jgi:GTP cyclohydrolase I
MKTKKTKAKVSTSLRQFRKGYRLIIDGLREMGYPVDTDPNFDETANRAAKGMTELVWPREKIDREINAILGVSFPLTDASGKAVGKRLAESSGHHIGDMVILHDKVFFSLCPHHLLPVIGRATVAYIPMDGRVLGLSKLARLVDIVSHQPLLQESFVQEIADRLHTQVNSGGSAAVASAIHLCMACRGAKAHETSVTVAAMRGSFDKNASTRKEFYDVLNTRRVTLIGG